MADQKPDQLMEPILLRLTNLTQTDVTPLLTLPCPSPPSLASFAPQPPADAAAALANSTESLQQAATLLRAADIRYLCVNGPARTLLRTSQRKSRGNHHVALCITKRMTCVAQETPRCSIAYQRRLC